MTEREEKFVDFLQGWQENNYEEIDTVEDVKMFNTIGNIVGLVNANMITLADAYEFVTLLKLDSDTRQRVFDVYFDAINHSNTAH